jgi:hypothetical protein
MVEPRHFLDDETELWKPSLSWLTKGAYVSFIKEPRIPRRTIEICNPREVWINGNLEYVIWEQQ